MAETIEARFKKAVWLIRNGPAEKSSNETKLLFYSYFKQVGSKSGRRRRRRRRSEKEAKAKKREQIDRLVFFFVRRDNNQIFGVRLLASRALFPAFLSASDEKARGSLSSSGIISRKRGELGGKRKKEKRGPRRREREKNSPRFGFSSRERGKTLAISARQKARLFSAALGLDAQVELIIAETERGAEREASTEEEDKKNKKEQSNAFSLSRPPRLEAREEELFDFPLNPDLPSLSLSLSTSTSKQLLPRPPSATSRATAPASSPSRPAPSTTTGPSSPACRRRRRCRRTST